MLPLPNPRLTPLAPNAVVTVDVALFTVRAEVPIHQAWQVLLVKPADPAFAGKWSFPGGQVKLDETFDAAARRALGTKAGLDAANWYLEQLGTFGAPDRDTRGRVVSIAHLALERSEELTLSPGGGIMRAEWVPVRGLPAESLAFDHADILRVAMNRTQSKLRYSWLAFQLLAETFTLPELRAIYAAILDPALERLNTGNFRKAFAPLFASEVLVPVGRRAAAGRVGRPGDLYRFTGPVAGTWERELSWHEPERLAATGGAL
ncbi:MAG TPA: NUDIX domain-containing protein [Candidatus Acidoferrales bacterium]|nr:NUDIX domain-containing protein [Candidatus Acidoferrales bacterium]